MQTTGGRFFFSEATGPNFVGQLLTNASAWQPALLGLEISV